MVLTREQVLELHRQMWGDMQDALGDNPIAWKTCSKECKFIQMMRSREEKKLGK